MSPPTRPAVVEASADAVEGSIDVVEASADGVGTSTDAVGTSAMLLCRGTPGEIAKMEGVGGMVGYGGGGVFAG